MNKISLDGKWQLFLAKHQEVQNFATTPKTISELETTGFKSIEAKVPGNFEIDLEKEGLLDDLFFGMNTLKAQELEDIHLFYCRKFSAENINKNSAELKFHGIDTIAEIYLNNNLIAETKNMMIEHVVDVSGLLLDENELVVHILPVFTEAEKHVHEAGSFFHFKYHSASLHVRKAPHTFGWDIMPRILSGGLWRSVELQEKQKIAIDDCYIYTTSAKKERALVFIYYRLKYEGNLKDYKLKITAKCKDSFYEQTVDIWHFEDMHKFYIENPYLWWPKNMGEPNLYDFTLELIKDGATIDTKELKIGLRTVKLERTSLTTNNGEGEFCFLVNGVKMFVMGTNWVPLDALHSRDAERLPKALELLDDIGVNMVRCWGGNVYEDHEFFDFCDTHGIAVWQDFSLGCAIYPQDEEFLSAIREEVFSVVPKLRNHPSLFLWAGDNEIDLVYATWSPLVRNPHDNKITRQVIPDALQILDPARTYIPSSPYIDETAFQSRKFNLLPENHLWGPRDYYKGDYYINSKAHFASETGYHGCVSPESVKKFISQDKIWPHENNKEWLVHATCIEANPNASFAYRIPLMAHQVRVLFGDVANDFETFSLASQISQAEAVKFFIERMRLGKWRYTGIIWWNLIDGWPQFSDAIVDYFYNKKVAYDYIKRSQQPVCIMFSEPKDNQIRLFGANELDGLQSVQRNRNNKHDKLGNMNFIIFKHRRECGRLIKNDYPNRNRTDCRNK
ncbi:MAG: glycoside hydrolase family 2, partial [Clostridia bacterium]|nr:glycoside hydrolase family 2 [Clostridia bacterium]